MDDKPINNFLEIIEELQREQEKKIEYLEKELEATKSIHAKLKKIREDVYNIYKNEAVRIASTNINNNSIVCNDIKLSTKHIKMLNKSLPELEELDKVYTIDEMAKILELEQSEIIFYHHRLNDFLNIPCIGAFQFYSREDVENLRRIKHLYVDLKMNMQDIKQYLKINRQEILLSKSQELKVILRDDYCEDNNSSYDTISSSNAKGKNTGGQKLNEALTKYRNTENSSNKSQIVGEANNFYESPEVKKNKIKESKIEQLRRMKKMKDRIFGI
ncbi:MerR family transcriptional regulator [Clostridium sp.]|uniref:MerR family transcriptional regulator n=1 Tax=Clostridium sp. TaxID=1506 RepID=UPI002851E89D|nr:MerR family transcriptional regulator [Clostridium sp.]MDR3594162.1 MerR family transcriptional regulator [Clostridium sp.]